ncbi:MAG TPA: hypothetical protein VHC63_15305 [Acidimicrobiales bacterium]|nr:hypothetical protein [Acidimicrobiales bacterium]
MAKSNELELRVMFKVQASCPNATPDEFRQGLEEQLGDVMEELLQDERVVDPIIGTEYSTGTVTFELIVAGSDEAEIVRITSGAIRAAIHGAGGATPGWSLADGNEGKAPIYTRIGFEADFVDA